MVIFLGNVFGQINSSYLISHNYLITDKINYHDNEKVFEMAGHYQLFQGVCWKISNSRTNLPRPSEGPVGNCSSERGMNHFPSSRTVCSSLFKFSFLVWIFGDDATFSAEYICLKLMDDVRDFDTLLQFLIIWLTSIQAMENGVGCKHHIYQWHVGLRFINYLAIVH